MTATLDNATFWLGAKGDTPKVRQSFERAKHKGPNLTRAQWRVAWGGLTDEAPPWPSVAPASAQTQFSGSQNFGLATLMPWVLLL